MPNGMQPGNIEVAANDAVRRHEATHHREVDRPERGIIGLVAKAEALVEHVQDILNRAERDGEIVVEMQTTLRIQMPGPKAAPVTRGGQNAD